MTRFLPCLILPEQGVFIMSQSIFYNINLSQELVQTLNKKVKGINVMLKNDMAKIYDRID